MSNKLATATDAPIDLVLPLLLDATSIEAEVVASEELTYWLITPRGQRIALDYGPKSTVDELETFISVDWDELALQNEILRVLQQLPYECRRFDKDDEKTVFRPENALPAEPWTPS
ncbi:hypothetical protein [Corynebacterium nasicanis]|uniref:Uncharacterized protein n=1 Tax=Corynebacterium nasicanis TaxID=1448267 RepID=A0ABW1Q9T0_9CORY